MDGECYKPSAKRKWLVFIVLKPLKMFTWFGPFYGSAGRAVKCPVLVNTYLYFSIITIIVNKIIIRVVVHTLSMILMTDF